MALKQTIARVASFMAVPAENPELLKAQYRAFSQQLPMMYFILISSTWGVALTHMAVAPAWLTIGLPVALTFVTVLRVADWQRSRRIEPTAAVARRALVRTNRLAAIIAATFTAWSLLLFPYGDAYAKAHLAFYMAITVIACIFSLTHLRSAAITVTVIVNGAFIVFFSLTGEITLIVTAINMALVSFALIVVLMINYRDFNRMILAQDEARRREEEQSRLLRMIDDMPVAVMTVDPESFVINYVNETSKRTLAGIRDLLPIDPDAIVGVNIDVFHKFPEHQRQLLADPANLPHHARIQLGPEVLDLQVSAVHAADGAYIGPMFAWSIVTQQVAAEERINWLARYDTLTALPNRATFRDRLEQSLALPESSAALLFIDLDGFKIVNDSKGHLVGDLLLQQVAERLRGVCDQPCMTLGRLGGDEFAILLEPGSAEEAAATAQLVIEALAAPYRLDPDRAMQIGASIGIAHAPEHGSDAETLLLRADIALYAAKAAGKGTFRVFSPEMETPIQARVRLETELREALEDHRGFYVFYQPIVDIRTGRVTAREALLRWHHPQRGWISPGEFIPVAEASGLIDRLGQFVLITACREAVGWEASVRIAVNVSAVQLGRDTLVPAIRAALDGSGLPAHRLEIEVTETALLGDGPASIQDLHRIRAMGVRVALDDFGTGFSSLAHLRAFPFDKIKIDGSFVRDSVDRPDCAAVVKAIADLGRRLGVTTVAEGVETQAHLARVIDEGCLEAQGYLFGRPSPSQRDAGIVTSLSQGPAGIPTSVVEGIG